MSNYYYACLRFKDGVVVREIFTDRDEARKYISEHFDSEIHDACWTE